MYKSSKRAELSVGAALCVCLSVAACIEGDASMDPAPDFASVADISGNAEGRVGSYVIVEGYLGLSAEGGPRGDGL